MPAPARILVVDDSPGLCDMLRELLEGLGFRVDVAGDGREALARLARGQRPALVMLDRAMPDLDGLEVLARVRANARWRDLPVLMVTSATTGHEVEEALAAGADEYLMKPFDTAGLVGKLRLLGFEPPVTASRP